MQKELLSAYMDGEQVNQDTTQALCEDDTLGSTWQNYHLIRSVMRQETKVMLGQDFTAKMESLISAEPTYGAKEDQPTVAETQHHPFKQKLKAMFMPFAQVAVAAGVCLAVVLGVQTSLTKEANTPDVPVLQTSPFNSNVQPVSYNAPTQDVVTEEKLEEQNKRIGVMLQNYELQRRMYADEAQLAPTK